MSGRWWRAYSRARHDPKLLKLSDKHFRWWFSLVCAAADNDGILPPHADLAVEFRTSGKAMTAVLDALITAGLFDHDETGIHPHNWNGLQYKADGASTERVRRYREKRRENGLPALSDYSKFRPALISRDGERCVYCEATERLVVDHMVPIALGGTDAQDNLALACKACNSGKAGRTPELANMVVRVTSAAKALARYRDAKRDVTVTETPSESETETDSSEAKASGGKPPADPVKELWDDGVRLLTTHGTNERNARGKIGDWRKKFGDERTHAGIKAAREQAVSEPIGWISKWLKAPSNAAAPRTAEEALSQIEGWKGLA